jgi:hypothetical protein
MTEPSDDLAPFIELGDRNACVRNHHALIGVAIESPVCPAVRSAEHSVPQDKLAEASSQRDRRQVIRPRLTFLVEERLVVERRLSRRYTAVYR